MKKALLYSAEPVSFPINSLQKRGNENEKQEVSSNHFTGCYVARAVEFPGGREIADYLCGRCKVAFIPVFYNGPDFYYCGMDDPEIMQFVNLPEEKTEEAIKKAEWYPLMDLKLKTNGPHIEHIDFS